ncbi:MAG: transposase [Candidatus Marinarcus sp.]|uniref:transposase n=1 Tax=Candidatus Marinarcus sp. TaxID=3100987 RepID=UPI003B000464
MHSCIYCHARQTYQLNNGHIKCAACKRKYSLKKFKQQKEIIKHFCNDSTALQTAHQLNLNYVTVLNQYKRYRALIIRYADEQYQNKKTASSEYDEYIYKKSPTHLGENFLTFTYENKIYNLMLPSLQKFTNYDNNEKDLSKFLFLHKIAKLESKHSLINDFWSYFESALKKYKGVENGNFIYYLKEIEFKFNHVKEVQEETLLKLCWA